MPKVLIVSPHFPPINAPDHQRIRMALPYFHQFGWEAHVICVRAEDVEGVLDEALLETVPDSIPVSRVAAVPVSLTKLITLRSLAWRAISPIGKIGGKLIGKESFDLVYFSTTMFLTMLLGPRWKRKFGVPYVIDYQDPWLSDYYQQEGKGEAPPGGRFKYFVAQRIAGLSEPYVLRRSSAITSVSPGYLQMLKHRYSWLQEDRFHTLPFGAADRDFELLPSLKIQQDLIEKDSSVRTIVYVGRGGSDMQEPLRLLFGALRELQEESEEVLPLKLYFIGTSYAPEGEAEESVQPIAVEQGVGSFVKEYPQRVPYFTAMQCLADSNAILLLGSADTRYSASKVFSCLLAQKPLISIVHEESPLRDILRRCGIDNYSTFGSSASSHGMLSDLKLQLAALKDGTTTENFEPHSEWIQKFSARAMTEELCKIFDQVLK